MTRAVLVSLVLGASMSAHGEPAHERIGLELRVGGQLARNYPEVAAYATIGLRGDYAVVLGYEAVRTYGVSLPKSCDTQVTPAVVSSLRAGVVRRVGLRHGFALRGAALLGVSAPALDIGPFPDGVDGVVMEGALDLAVTWAWRVVELGLFVDVSYGAGSLSSAVCDSTPAQSASVSELGLLYGLGVAVRW